LKSQIQLAYFSNNLLLDSKGGFIDPKQIVGQAHALGLKVGIYTIYDSREPSNRGCGIGQCEPENKEMELFYYFDMGVDGMFVENVGEARELRMTYQYRIVDGGDGDGGDKNSGVAATGSMISWVIIIIMMTGTNFFNNLIF
jgi:hypothetical protein